MIPLVFDGRPRGPADVAAAVIAAGLRLAADARGACSLAVSGGGTPNTMFDILAGLDVPWAVTHIFQVDERVAPDGHPDRNATALAEHLLDRVPVPVANIHLMPVTDDDPVAAARRYDGQVHEVTGGDLDVIHLGLGDDGHTASWPPGDPVSDLTDGPGVTVVGPFNGRLRMTLTPPLVNRARTRVWLVEGAGKASMVARLLRRDGDLPASNVSPDNTFFVTDAGAAVRFLALPGG
jgi:6-phosphogluconolactonase